MLRVQPVHRLPDPVCGKWEISVVLFLIRRHLKVKGFRPDYGPEHGFRLRLGLLCGRLQLILMFYKHVAHTLKAPGKTALFQKRDGNIPMQFNLTGF